MILVGANDGLLHAFNAETGVEEWAFIPPGVLKTLKLMSTAHTYYVDGSPKVSDVWLNSTPNDTTKSADKWRTVLICGSWVTSSGAEIGIAQAVQAWAARTDPSEHMNPVLLKPKGDRTSQVIVLGRPVADKSAEEYYRGIDVLKSVVDRSIQELEKDYDYIVVEGAGGAAEINLYERDITNIATWLAIGRRPSFW